MLGGMEILMSAAEDTNASASEDINASVLRQFVSLREHNSQGEYVAFWEYFDMV